MEDRETSAGSPEFWKQQSADDRREWIRYVIRWLSIFVIVVAAMLFALWWSRSAVDFGSSRVQGNTEATWRVHGVVREAGSGKPVAWALIEDSSEGRGPHFNTTAGFDGSFELDTIAEPHEIVVSALAYRPKRLGIGRAWYLWMPRGSERVDILLERE